MEVFESGNSEKVFAQADGNLGNVLFDEGRCSLLDFEDSGWSDASFELADLFEHPSSRLAGLIDITELASQYGPGPLTLGQLPVDREAFAVFWFNLLLPGNPAHHRNPPGSLENQARHLIELSGSRAIR